MVKRRRVVAAASAAASLGATLGVAALLSAAAPAPTVTPPSTSTAKKPPVARGHENVRVVDDELMVSDPSNPRRLISKRPGVIDRKWIERTAMPRIPSAVLDDLERVMPAPTGDRTLRSPEAPPLVGAAFAPQLNGNVLIVDGEGLVGNTQNGLGFDHNNGSFEIINTALGFFGDSFDFVTVFTTFPDANVAAYYFPIKQDTDGLGECDFQAGSTFGCLFDQTQGQLEVLQGFVFMNDLTTWQDFDRNFDGVAHDVSDFDSSLFSTLGQEVAHRWGSGLRFVDRRTDRVSTRLLGRDQSHWAAFVDTDASVMDGWDWGEESGSVFPLLNDMDNFSTLDLYTMGVLPPAAAKPFFFIDDARYDEPTGQLGIDGRPVGAEDVLGSGIPSIALLKSFGVELGATGDKIPVTIQDVADAEGNRCPDPGAAQKSFRQAIILVTRPGQTPAQVASIADDLNIGLATWEAWWLDRTQRALRLCTDINADCDHAIMEVTAGEVTTSESSLQPGSTGTLTLSVTASGRDVENAKVTLRALGDSADFTSLPETVDIGDIDAGDTKTVSVDVDYADDYPCGFSSLIRATVSSDNAADVTEEIRSFPGLKVLEAERFASEDHPWGVNADEKDGTTRGDEGALQYTENVELTCDMTKRSVERDASPGDRGAFVTGPGTDHVPNLIDNDAGEGAELDGDTSLWSPSFSLSGTRDPEFRFAYWFDGDDGDVLKVQLSGDGEKTFLTGKEVTESFHGWVVGRISVRDVFGNVPEKVTLRFIFEGNGTLEGGVDDVILLDYDGQCLSAARGGFCGCDQDGSATPTAPLAALIGLVALKKTSSKKKKKTGVGGGIDGDTTPVL